MSIHYDKVAIFGAITSTRSHGTANRGSRKILAVWQHIICCGGSSSWGMAMAMVETTWTHDVRSVRKKLLNQGRSSESQLGSISNSYLSLIGDAAERVM